MSKTAKDPRGTAKCENCIFGRAVTISDKDKSGKETDRGERLERVQTNAAAHYAESMPRPDGRPRPRYCQQPKPCAHGARS